MDSIAIMQGSIEGGEQQVVIDSDNNEMYEDDSGPLGFDWAHGSMDASHLVADDDRQIWNQRPNSVLMAESGPRMQNSIIQS